MDDNALHLQHNLHVIAYVYPPLLGYFLNSNYTKFLCKLYRAVGARGGQGGPAPPPNFLTTNGLAFIINDSKKKLIKC